VSEHSPAARAGAVLLDIEGTTTPVTFVTDVLFPYARRHLRLHLEEHAGSREYESLFTRLGEEHRAASAGGETPPPWTDEPRPARLAAVAAFVDWLMDRDRKSTALKELQGKIWQDGYERGELVGQVFPDVRPALERWRDQRVPVSIFSSGSVLAQQLLFRHSSAGNLTPLLHAYFDTRVGQKADAESYGRIARAVGIAPESFVFISDVTRELDAARAAGMHARLAIRPGNAVVPARHGFVVIHSLDAAAAATGITTLG
jgi:enolase-phosphatase E1